MSLLEQQLDNIRIIQSLFCLPGECELADETEACLSSAGQGSSKHDLELTLHLSLDSETESVLDVSVTLAIGSTNVGLSGPLQWSANIARPSSFTQREYVELVQRAEKELVLLQDDVPDDIPAQLMAWCDWLKTYVQDARSEQASRTADIQKQSLAMETLVRIWMHLPSLSTRTKRDDLVRYAPQYGITGVVCAGKPGVIILEAPTAADIESYLAFIKKHSWADIPPGHKKISEKLRETGLPPAERVFEDMREITDEVNADGFKGARSNRGDMAALRGYLQARGLGDRFGVLFGSALAI